MKSTASAVWEGGLKDGKGKLTSGTGIFTDTPYTFAKRFEGTGSGTTPEELIAAAHAACFAMALAAELQRLNLAPERITTNATVKLEKTGNGWSITEVLLDTSALVPDAEQATFDKAADAAKEGCPVSRLLKAKIKLEAVLEPGSFEERRTG